MSVHKVAVISDTHGTLRPKALEILKSAEIILHAGDVTSQKTLEQLKECGNLILVRGNCDKSLTEEVPVERLFELFGKKIYMIHDRKQVTDEAHKADLVIFGHSHKYFNEIKDGQIWLNPGSGGPRRFGNPVSMAVLSIDSDTGEIAVEKIDLNDSDKSYNRSEKSNSKNSSKDIIKSIDIVLKELRKGRSVSQIIKKYRLDTEQVNQICQLYFTHPGIDKQGILNRLEIKNL